MVMVTVVNLSKKKSFRASKRIISAVLPSVSNRVNVGDVPVRVLVELIRKLREKANRGTAVKVFFESPTGYVGVKCVEVGRASAHLQCFVNTRSPIDSNLALIKVPLSF